MGCQGSKTSTARAPGTAPPQESPIRALNIHPEAAKATSDGKKPTSIATTEDPASAAMEKPASCELSCGNDSTMPSCGQASGGAQNHVMQRRRQATLCTEKHELDIMVVQFSAHESTVGSAIGRSCKEMQWKVMFDRDAAPIDIKLRVQEHKLHSNEVSIESDGQAIFHSAGSHAKAKMTEDFRYCWPFRATIRGINDIHAFEMHLPHLHSEDWFPATITGQRADGQFEVTAQEPDSSGCLREIKYPAVDRTNLREAASGKPLAVPEECLILDVPKQDPLSAVFSVGGEPVTNHFGRPSPPVSATQKKTEVAMKVSQDRSVVKADVGHSVLKRFETDEVQGIRNEVERLKHSWTFELGPFAEHTVEITKKYTLGKIVTLQVDGEVLVEGSAAEIGCQGSVWRCDFQLVGERVLDFEVYKTNRNGDTLDSTDHVKEIRKHVHKCSVLIPNDKDFTSAQLLVDGTLFRDLPMKYQDHEEPSLNIDPMALMHSYGISVPYKVDLSAPSNIASLVNSVVDKAGDGKRAVGGLFAWCQDSTSVVNDVEAL